MKNFFFQKFFTFVSFRALLSVEYIFFLSLKLSAGLASAATILEHIHLVTWQVSTLHIASN